MVCAAVQKVQWDRPVSQVKEEGSIQFEYTLQHGEEDAVTFMIQPIIGKEKQKNFIERP
ncbi:hypothetical protein GCM10020331_090370 [Ectobacillus funiculus]